MYGYIYLTTNLINHKKYIGRHKSGTFTENYKGSGKLLWLAIRKYGWENFKVELLEECDTEEDLNRAEAMWIAKSNAIYSDEYYNLARGGKCVAGAYPHPMLGKHHSDETKRKMSEKAQGRVGDLNHFYGKKHSEDSKRKMSAAHKLNPSKSHTTQGRVWVNNGGKNYLVPKDDLGSYLSEGYERGFLSKDYDRRTCLGRCWVNNGEISKSVKDKDLDYYLSKGFVRGRIYDKVWVSKDDRTFMVDVCELEDYVSKGYVKGRGKFDR